MNTLTAPLAAQETKAGRRESAQLQQWKRHLACWESLASREIGWRRYVSVPDKCIDELDHVLAAGHAATQTREDLMRALPECAELASSLHDELLTGSGFVVLDRFPVKRYGAVQCRQLAGLMGSLISPLMAQDRHGTRLYDVLDNGASGTSVRRSKTNQEQPFHTDGAWFSSPPAFIGLFCIQPAMAGGSSQLASLPVALDNLYTAGAFDLARLSEPVYWNRMAEHQAGEQPYSYLPLLERSTGTDRMRYYVDYVESGYALANQPFPEPTKEMFRQIDQALTETAIEPFALEAGQLQYVNNGLLVHARGRFSDGDTGDRGRHLVRIWNEYP